MVVTPVMSCWEESALCALACSEAKRGIFCVDALRDANQPSAFLPLRRQLMWQQGNYWQNLNRNYQFVARTLDQYK